MFSFTISFIVTALLTYYCIALVLKMNKRDVDEYYTCYECSDLDCICVKE